MSYHIYTTDGIILKKTVFGEASLLLHVLTKDLGLIMASARSARLSVSKLRPGLQEYSLISLSCIRGKNGWKITNVAYKDSFYFGETEYSKIILAKITKVLLQIVSGEMAQPRLYEIILGGISALRGLTMESAQQIEVMLLLRLLYELGYVAQNDVNKKYIQDVNNWNEDLVQSMKDDREAIVKEINQGLKLSQM